MDDGARQIGRFWTGTKAGDYAAGFLLTLVSPLLFCFGGMIPILAYARYRAQYPALGRAIGLGLLVLAVVAFLLPFFLLYAIRENLLGPFMPGA